ncbi:MAG TPA: MgtC/SapB family protein [Acidimicrobiales bacterium]|nr:MgtC/SapB family protein [Acidimicrobiales bacterium]
MEAADLGWLEVLGRLGAALVFGGVVGFEREVDGHDAGLRTHALLAVGAAVFGAISVGGFATLVTDDPGSTNIELDVTRVASYVAAGVGFLGGGAILKGSDHVKGLTTAASLWTVAGIGLAAGLGFWPAAVVATVLAAVTLLADVPLRKLVARMRPPTSRSG